MNKLIGIICFFHVLASFIHAAEEPKEQKQKIIPNAIIWGLKNPIAPIPAKKQINENICDINTQNKKGQTPLHIACEKNNESIVKLLCSKNIAFNKPDKKGLTPFHIVCMHNYTALVALLLVQFNRFPHDRLSYITA